MIAKDREGNNLPILSPDYSVLQYIDGSNAHAEGAKLPAGIYRIAIVSSVDTGGVHLKISEAGTSATVANGIFMPHGSIEYFPLEEGSIISVIGGKINVVKFS